MSLPPRIHIVGRRNCGKTTLVCNLLQEFGRRGLQTATVKHTHHPHELDTPGKDSWKHRQAGASMVGILSPQLTAVFQPHSQHERGEERYAVMLAAAQHCDLVIVEGDLHTSAPKLEVWREVATEPPYATDVPGIHAVISTRQSIEVPCPVWSGLSIEELAERVLQVVAENR